MLKGRNPQTANIKVENFHISQSQIVHFLREFVYLGLVEKINVQLSKDGVLQSFEQKTERT